MFTSTVSIFSLFPRNRNTSLVAEDDEEADIKSKQVNFFATLLRLLFNANQVLLLILQLYRLGLFSAFHFVTLDYPSEVKSKLNTHCVIFLIQCSLFSILHAISLGACTYPITDTKANTTI